MSLGVPDQPLPTVAKLVLESCASIVNAPSEFSESYRKQTVERERQFCTILSDGCGWLLASSAVA
jgi:hypothetical protein